MPTRATVTVGAAAGTGGTATLDSGANDTRGQVTVTSGASGAGAGLLATVALVGSWQNYKGGGPYPFVTLQEDNVKSAAIGTVSIVLGPFGMSLLIYCTGTVVNTATYRIDYLVAHGPGV